MPRWCYSFANMRSLAGIVASVAFSAAILAFVFWMVWKAIKVTIAGRRANRSYAETSKRLQRGEITALEAIGQHYETHARFKRGARP